MGWFITQSLLFIIVTAIIFFLIGLWVGWILWARRNKATGKHTAETAEKKPAASATKGRTEQAGSATKAGAAKAVAAVGAVAGANAGTGTPDTGTATGGADASAQDTRTATPLAAPTAEAETDGATGNTADGSTTAGASTGTDPGAGTPTTGTATEPSDIEDENLAVFAGVEAEVVAEAEAATREAVVDEAPGDAGAGTAAATVVGSDGDAGARARPDDLTRIEGIGPKIAGALEAAGYGSYTKLADAAEEDIREALADSGIKFAPAAVSFAAQAQYLALGDEEGLEEYQDYLIAGRERRSADFVEEVDYTDVDEVGGEAAKQAALAADAAKAAEATGEEIDADAVSDDAEVAGDATGEAEAAGDATGETEAAGGVADATGQANDAEATTDAAGEAEAAAAVVPEPEEPADEDLKVIEGIGPKIEKVLKAAGITSYAQVAAASEAELRESIGKGGIRFAPSVKTWAQQAQYLVEGDGGGLDEYQDYLIGGQERGTTKFVEEVDYTDVDEVEGEAAKQTALAADARKVAEAEGEKA